MHLYYYTDNQGTVCSPVSKETLEALCHQGKLADTCQIFLEHEQKWELLSEYLSLSDSKRMECSCVTVDIYTGISSGFSPKQENVRYNMNHGEPDILRLPTTPGLNWLESIKQKSKEALKQKPIYHRRKVSLKYSDVIKTAKSLFKVVMSFLLYASLFTVIVLIVALIVSLPLKNSKKEEALTEQLAQPPTFDEKAEALFSLWDGSNRTLKELVKNRLHNPDSFVHDGTHWEIYTPTEILVVMKFRAQNGFGATRTSIAYFIQNVDTKQYRSFFIKSEQ